MRRFSNWMVLLACLLVLVGCTNTNSPEFLAQMEEEKALLAYATESEETEGFVATPKPTTMPTAAPTPKPTATPKPTVAPTPKPTTAPTAKPTATPTPTPSLMPRLQEITADTVIDSGLSEYVTAFDFMKQKKYGADYSSSSYYDACFPYEGRWGIDAYVDGMTICLKAYSHLDERPKITSAKIQNKKKTYESMGGQKLVDLIGYDDYQRIDLSGFSGTYRLNLEFVIDGEKKKFYVPFFVNGDEVWLCKLTGTYYKNLIKRRETMEKVTSDLNITPANSLSLDEVTYPINQTDKYRCDTNRWAALSDEIIEDKSWSDEYKVLAIHNWITDNLAYDYYKTEVMGVPRDFYYDDHSGKYSTYDTHVGVCHDFAHVMLIMCRHQGIPAIICSDETHEWVAVYLDGHWQEMDITADVRRGVWGEDVNDVQVTGIRGYRALAQDISSELIYVNFDLWTMATVYGGENYPGYYPKRKSE